MKMMRTLLALSIILSGSYLCAQSESKPLLKMKVPFPFVVEDQTLPAGEYLVSALQPERTILISCRGARLLRIQIVSPHYARRPSENSRLIFDRYGNTYFLREVWTTGTEVARVLPQSRAETELARVRTKTEVAMVARASSGR